MIETAIPAMPNVVDMKIIPLKPPIFNFQCSIPTVPYCQKQYL